MWPPSVLLFRRVRMPVDLLVRIILDGYDDVDDEVKTH